MRGLIPVYDLIVGLEVLVYFGDLGPLFGLVHDRLAKGGRFVLSTDRNDSADISLNAAGRYLHGPDYVRARAKASNFEIEFFDARAALRYENEKPNPAILALLRNRA